jgi:hypothetical protein
VHTGRSLDSKCWTVSEYESVTESVESRANVRVSHRVSGVTGQFVRVSHRVSGVTALTGHAPPGPCMGPAARRWKLNMDETNQTNEEKMYQTIYNRPEE